MIVLLALCALVSSEFSGSIFEDNNENGVQDVGEPGIPGVIIDTIDRKHNAITHQDGTYTLPLDQNNVGLSVRGMQPALDLYELVPDSSVVSVRTARPIMIGTDIYLNANWPSEEYRKNANFALRRHGATVPDRQTLNIGEFVFHDLNGNGLRESGEPGIANVSIEVRSGGHNFIARTATDQNGWYNVEISAIDEESLTIVIFCEQPALSNKSPTKWDYTGNDSLPASTFESTCLSGYTFSLYTATRDVTMHSSANSGWH